MGIVLKNLFKILVVRLLINLADSLFSIVTIWRVADVFNSSVSSGILMALFTIPEVLQVFIGPVVDRYNPKKILIFASTCQLIILIILLLTWNIQSFALIGTLTFFSATASSITYPIEDVLIPQIVSSDKLVLANSLFSVSYQTMNTMFNAVSGFLSSVFTFLVLYNLDLILFAIVFIPLSLFKFVQKMESTDEKFNGKAYVHDLQEGYRFISKNSLLLEMAIPLIFINFFNSVNAVALPYYSKTFSNEELVYGTLLTACGIGGIIGGVIVNFFSNRLPAGKMISLFLILNGVFWNVGIFIHNLFLSTLFFFLNNLFSSMSNIVYDSLYQTLPPIKILGRVNTTVDSLITIAMPLGGVVGGFLLTFLSANLTLSLYGLCVINCGFFYLTRHNFIELPVVSKLKRLE